VFKVRVHGVSDNQVRTRVQILGLCLDLLVPGFAQAASEVCYVDAGALVFRQHDLDQRIAVPASLLKRPGASKALVFCDFTFSAAAQQRVAIQFLD
jgi:hypothetical protein